ncbi:MAG: hypothetical protein WCO04_15515 [Pseudomonadota bacterium]
MTSGDVPADATTYVVGEDELQRLTATRFPAGPESDAFFASLGPADYWNNLLTVVVDARKHLLQITGLLHEVPPDPNTFDVFSHGWYAATCWSYADALLLREDAILEKKLAWSQMLGAMMTEWDWRYHYKAHIVRGATTQKDASEGGKAKSRGSDSPMVIEYMKSRVEKFGVSGAARMAHEQGKLGSSAEANRKIWLRRQKAMVTPSQT